MVTEEIEELSNKPPEGQQPKISSVLSGVSGEYFVAAELSRRGYIASITLRNTKGIDVLVSNEGATRSVGLQVKTNQGNRNWWLLDKKAEDYFADNLFYVFVNLKNQASRPDFHVVPSIVVAEFVKKNHAEWLQRPGKRVKQHADTRMRAFRIDNEKYLENWAVLGL